MTELDGLWCDDEGILHVHAERVLRALGKAVTDDNKRTLLTAIRKQVHKLNPQARFLEQVPTDLGPIEIETDVEGNPFSSFN